MDTPPSDARPNVPATLDLYSLRHLEALLGRSRAELEELAKHAVRYYRPFLLKRKEQPFAQKSALAKKRLIDNPIDPLKAIQSRIEERLLKRLVLPRHLLGGVPGKSIPDNAKLHLGARYLVTVDIRNFFPSITPQQVRSVWRETLNCSPDVAYLLTGLTTARDRLPQGAPTSTLLANLVLSSFDMEIRSVCELSAVCYSSWVDDLAFSGDSAPSVVGPVIAALMKAGFSVSHQKIKVMGPGKRKILNKLVLGRFVTVQRQYVSRIRAGIHNLKCGKVTAPEMDDYTERLEGSIGYLRLFDTGKARKFHEQLEIVRVMVMNA
jgi:RNA-directed DNA polymerase